jgi:signal peptidase II
MLKWFGVSAAVIVLDQLTKYAVKQTFALHEVMEITPFFNMLLVYNKGAAFSMLSDAGGWQRGLFIGIAIGASVWIGWLLRKHAGDRVFCLALALILGGALGNVIDRITIGGVADFLDFHAYGVHFPAFNVADIAISCGAMLLVFDALRTKPAAAASNPRRV